MTKAPGLVRRLLRKTPERLRWSLYRHYNQLAVLRSEGVVMYALWMLQRNAMWVAARLMAPGYYVRLSPEQAGRQRRSDTVFIFGSGYSLNDLSPEEWAHIAEHDTFSFGGFVYQDWVRVDFHLLRSWDPQGASIRRWPKPKRTFIDTLNANPRFRDAISIVQDEHSGTLANTLVGLRWLPRGSRLVSYWTARRVTETPTRRWRDGITHAQGATVDCVNIAYLLGWKRIVLVGVDLYDNRYFWGRPDACVDFDEDGNLTRSTPTQDHGARWDEPHLTARRGVVETLGEWREIFAREGVSLEVYNSRSLLTARLPVYEPPIVMSRD